MRETSIHFSPDCLIEDSWLHGQHELKQRTMAGIDDVNRHPVIHTWTHKLAEAA
ncbi:MULTISPECIES: hypothetical protein [Rhizobium]|uniref:Uncharacterized protein n=1 Tax=Rhizobium favelukesii TaxID=348824 RepID=W6RKD2_9HYPH|nr:MULTISPECIES: hypothetical protein [Rhizobium]MCA0804744.1 hypothetical protein [Rhizobium sp. T1473]MCS0458019.1 hypothetical protein [Rhizobium favelukesii]UFS79875.1 hypothetical protein LPB79_00695 [Rhizobium sp. T136]CDM61587.1 hypothetical protein LPU83_pLPU83d_0216 [Rhizobium favelukesii]